MKRKIMRVIAFIVCMTLVFSMSLTAYATNGNNNGRFASFKDVPQGYWAYDQIMWMLDNKIIEGIGNNMFGPNNNVTRAQFAKMMVLTLDIDLYSPGTPSFLDVGKNAWEYPYVESAKSYLTGFRTSAGDYFRPAQNAVREDMAVALVKALGYQNESADESILNQFADANQISPNLRRYVALSVKHKLVEGFTQNGRTLFNPQGNLTRAEAATLLYRAFKNAEEKVTYDENGNKVVYDDDGYIKPTVWLSYENEKLVVHWNRIGSSNLQGYAIVISQYDSTPQYPENGYLDYITDRNQTSYTIKNDKQYNGGNDFGGYLQPGVEYYFSVTAVYSGKNVAGNVQKAVYNGISSPTLHTAPSIYTSIENGALVVRWNKVTSVNLQGYIVIISKDDSSPSFPENGYLYWFSDNDRTYAVINNSTAYHDGDFGKYLTKGEKYFVNVSAVYSDRYVPSNTLRFTYDGADNPESYVTPSVNAATENGILVLRWNRIDSSNLSGYRVVISKNDSSPSYPDNGYLYWFTDRNRTYAVINNTEAYHNGDFGRYLTKGEEYYANVTAVYKDRNVKSNTVRITYNGTENPEAYVAPIVKASTENSKLVLRWNKIDSANLLGYRVVASKSDNTPGYPENGYLSWITDRDRNYFVVDNSKAYVNGDFGKYFVNGEYYYFSITAVYKDKNVRGNSVEFQYDGEDNPEFFPAPVVKVDYEDGKLIVRWNRIDSPYLTEYRLVISKKDPTPAYPANGYYGIYDKNRTGTVVSSSVDYKDGDFKNLTDGTEYYFSVTAVYNNDKYVAGNTIGKLFLLPPK